jgi:hypothetical protein
MWKNDWAAEARFQLYSTEKETAISMHRHNWLHWLVRGSDGENMKCCRLTCPRLASSGQRECGNCLKRYRKLHWKLRDKVVKHYGGKCVCCGINDWEFLTIDHKKGRGAKHRRKTGSGAKFYRWVIEHNYPKYLQVLCQNCNQSLGNYGYCPHRPEIKRKVLKGK